ncbi:MAG: VWA domain-containing protein, partial [Bdellovibrionales bacterium]|nr:VWA domain-containing protein [Bdellovibrionales bacterium]
MNFVNTKYLPHIIGGVIFLAILFSYLNSKYFKWIKTYWFFERSWMSRITAFVYIISIALMLISLLDLRGPEQKVKSELPDQKTIIILDSSTSMFAEDVRPNRFGKAIQLARHFVKSAAGHQISIVLFSDLQKRLIPFTDDIDLLDSRLAALEKTNAVGGGSNISQAIAEAVGYFGDDGKNASGNILVFTDAEESEGSFDIDLGSGINLAVIGVGTAKGSNIPLRWEDGSFRGYKMNKGEQVITKLDEAYIKKLGKNVKNYKYWIANSYSLPTEEIMNFFRSIYNKTNGKGDMRVRPVFSHLILIPAIILYCISIVLGRFASFKTLASFLILSFFVGSS